MTARAYFVEATRLGNEGRWREARELYGRSLQLKPAPITRYSLGVAEKETGRYADAVRSFRAFLAEPPEPATAPYVEPARAALAELEGYIGRVTISIDPRPIEGLTLTIDGQPAPPALDQPREIEPGAHEILARAPGFRATTTRFSVAAGGTATVAMAMARLTKAPVIVGAPATAPIPEDVAPAPLSPRRNKVVPIALMGSGGALFVAGLTTGLVGVKQASDASTRTSPEASAARAKAIAGDIVGGVGVVTAGVGLVLLLTQRRSSPATAAGARPWVTADAAGLGLRF